MENEAIDTALDRLISLSPGRHYGASRDSDCWVMIGRNLREVTSWSIVPPSASLTLTWGDGGCAVEFGGGTLEMRSGDWMWIDAGFAHRGDNLPGSDFLTVFIPDKYVLAASLDLAPIGAAAQPAPPALAEMLIRFAICLLDGVSTRSIEAPLLDTILDWVGIAFAPLETAKGHGNAAARAAAMLRADHRNQLRITDIADAVGLSGSELSRQFKAYYRLTPALYRKQLRLALATRALASGSSVLAAAHNAGFSDTAHLSRTFRAQYGIAPSQWSRRIAGAEPFRIPDGVTLGA
ncbi:MULTISPECIES: AraC family transcriptional regulator [unclassified Sphingomonas]|uniref:helix-turn-helix transcriptional regulator n=1 Tax=unclassified Sphingomonas TaxID=196159 RepID=UPI000BD6FFA6|nr:MAG: hypothetical protein B7Z43_06420 [Sphingomonas sp. 12-62-6]OYX37113.1 MAG: hypothetical protein B7Y98_13745 [Sphingomonas sp. 32-62-10]